MLSINSKSTKYDFSLFVRQIIFIDLNELEIILLLGPIRQCNVFQMIVLFNLYQLQVNENDSSESTYSKLFTSDQVFGIFSFKLVSLKLKGEFKIRQKRLKFTFSFVLIHSQSLSDF